MRGREEVRVQVDRLRSGRQWVCASVSSDPWRRRASPAAPSHRAAHPPGPGALHGGGLALSARLHVSDGLLDEGLDRILREHAGGLARARARPRLLRGGGVGHGGRERRRAVHGGEVTRRAGAGAAL